MENRQYSYKIYIGIFLVCLCVAGMITAGAMRKGENIAGVQSGIAEEVLRFHVMANSNTKEDQQLKMQVKTEVVSYLKKITGEQAGLEETKKAAEEHLKDIAGVAQRAMIRQKKVYPVRVSLGTSYFPEKSYGDCCLPAGRYEALKIEIGAGEGANWWCVLYPSLCFVDESYAVMTENKMQEMKKVLTVEEYETITKHAKVKIRFKWVPWELGS